RSSPSSRPAWPRSSRIGGGRRRSPGTTSSATSRPRPGRWPPVSPATLTEADAYRAIVIGYALIGILMAVGAWRLDVAIEAPPARVSTDGIRRRFGLHRSKAVVLKL